jgi:polar amino acid transport system substrate-binding protein
MLKINNPNHKRTLPRLSSKPYRHIWKPAIEQLIRLVCYTAITLGTIATVSITMAVAQQSVTTPEDEALRERTVLRLLTSADYPPFNYYDEEGNLAGFHIDLANAICREMAVRCDIRVNQWDNLLTAFNSSDYDAIIAGHAINAKNLRKLDFTNPYMRMPARFAILKRRPQPEPTPKRLEGKTVGVIKATSHKAYLQSYFKGAKLVTFNTQRDATSALQRGEIDYLFGDAIQIMFWLNGSLSQQCCQFRGDSYWDANYFGEGLAIAISKGDMRLRIELNDAIRELRRTGQFEELMLRYFPLKIY